MQTAEANAGSGHGLTKKPYPLEHAKTRAQVLGWLVEGKTYREIAALLSTVRSKEERIRRAAVLVDRMHEIIETRGPLAREPKWMTTYLGVAERPTGPRGARSRSISAKWSRQRAARSDASNLSENDNSPAITYKAARRAFKSKSLSRRRSDPSQYRSPATPISRSVRSPVACQRASPKRSAGVSSL